MSMTPTHQHVHETQVSLTYFKRRARYSAIFKKYYSRRRSPRSPLRIDSNALKLHGMLPIFTGNSKKTRQSLMSDLFESVSWTRRRALCHAERSPAALWECSYTEMRNSRSQPFGNPAGLLFSLCPRFLASGRMC